MPALPRGGENASLAGLLPVVIRKLKDFQCYASWRRHSFAIPPLASPMMEMLVGPLVWHARIIHRSWIILSLMLTLSILPHPAMLAPYPTSPDRHRRQAMKPRLNPYQAAPETMKALMALETHIAASGLEPSLIDLVKTRASQINGCAYCIHMHTREARAHGETEERLYLLDAWHESPLYSARERAALAWTEALTLIAHSHAPDDAYEELCKHFDEAETVKLTVLIGAINVWNRIAISFRAVHPQKAKVAAE
jgi:AhpD family alkylhydroperoxidase